MPRSLCMLALAALATLGGCAGKTPAVPESAIADANYLVALGLMRGHLLVGHALYGLGELSAAQSHAKHPADELYATVAAEFAQRGVAGFAEELQAHANALQAGEAAGVAAAYADVVEAVGRTESAVTLTSSLAGRVIADLLREAAREYDIGVVDGELANAHEYQDAYGFTQVALALARTQHAALPADDGDRAVFAGIAQQIGALGDLWPALMPPPQLPHSAIRLAAAAQEVERATLQFKPINRFR